LSKEKVTTTPQDDLLPEVNVDSEINFAAAEIEELLADGPASSEGGGQPWQSHCGDRGRRW